MVSTPMTNATVRHTDHLSPRRWSRTTPYPYSARPRRQATRKNGSGDHWSPRPSVNGGRSMVMPCPLCSIGRLLIRGGCASLSAHRLEPPPVTASTGGGCDDRRLKHALRFRVAFLGHRLQ